MLLGIYALLPLVVVLSRYSIAMMVVGGMAIFTIKFSTVLWYLAMWVDQNLILSMYPDVNVFLQIFVNPKEILISSGLHDEAYRRFGLSAAQGNSYLARYRAVAKRYPMMAPAEILADLIKTTQGEEGKWFATAKELKLYDLALELANQSPCDPKTLTRAARDYLDSEPVFALGSAMAALRWLSEGWGYEVTSVDVMEAHDRAMDAATRLNKADSVSEQIRLLVEVNDNAGRHNAARQFVLQALQGRLRGYGDDNSPVA